jgi:hypothetical protein
MLEQQAIPQLERRQTLRKAARQGPKVLEGRDILNFPYNQNWIAQTLQCKGNSHANLEKSSF